MKALLSLNLYLKILLILGIILRVFFQFFEPAFFLDEIYLGTNIKTISFSNLLFPPSNFQSAPPLYLLTQKIIINTLPFPFWINIKLLSTLCAIGSLILFYKIIKNVMPNIYGLMMFGLFVLNPYIIYNSLTVKQYTCDLVGIMILIYFYNHPKFKRYSWIFFMIWILYSNAALIAFAGYAVFEFIRWIKDGKSVWNYIKSYLKLIIAPLPYVLYFLWYIMQPGAEAQHEYMLQVWQGTFITFSLDGLKLLLTLGHVIYTHFFSIYEIIGVIMSLICIIGLFLIIKKKEMFQYPTLILGGCILPFHLLLNALHTYPIVERSLLYLVPFFILLFGYSLKKIVEYFGFGKVKFKLVFVTIIISSLLYITHLPQKKNNVVKLYKSLDRNNDTESFYITTRALDGINKFNEFTNYKFKKDIDFMTPDGQMDKSKYLISWVHKKLKHQSLYNNESEIQHLLDQGKIVLIAQVDSYNIFKIL